MTDAPQTTAAQKIFGAGEMADRTRTFHWAANPLGPIDQWPEALIVTVNTLLESRCPMFLFWGPELIQFYNDAYRPSFGDDKHPAALGQRGTECWPEIWPFLGPVLAGIFQNGEPFWTEDQLIPVMRNGHLVDAWWTISYSPVRDTTGTIRGVLTACLETTARVQADRRLAEMLEAATDGIMTIDRDWTITFLNENAIRTLPNSGHVLGKNFWEAFPGTVYDDSIYVKTYNAAMQDGLPGQFEAFYPEPLNGWYQVNVRPSSDGITLFFTNISPRKLAEQAVLTERARLLEVFQQAPAFFTLLRGPNHIFEMANPPYRQLIGGDRDILGKPVREAIPEAESQGFLALLDNVYNTGEPFIGTRIPIQLARDTGRPLELRYLDFVYQPYREANGTIAGIIALGVDVTESKRAEEVLVQTEKLAAVGRLASSIAHEINNPLEAVTNLLYLAQHSAHDDTTSQYLYTAQQELARVSTIANQTLRFYRQSTNPRAITPQELIDGTLPLYQGKLNNSHVTIERRDRSSRAITCFDGEIRQVLSNLIGNAIDAMTSNHESASRLIVRSREATHWPTNRKGIILTVADTGTGMSPHTAAHVFEPFFTTKGISGTGLGLWISHEIIERHKGAIKVRSSQSPQSSGTVFQIFLPSED